MIKVIGWIDYDNFNFATAEGTNEEIEAVAKELKSKGYKFGGDDHENHSNCCPVLSNGKALRLSWRGWGGVMAIAYNLKTDNNDYNYILWYMGEYAPEERSYPKKELDISSLKDRPVGKEIIYELTKDEVDAIHNASFVNLVLPYEYNESINLRAFDNVILKYEDIVLIEAYVNGSRFTHFSIEEFTKKDDLLDMYPSDYSNFRNFDKDKLAKFIKDKYDISDDKLVIISLNFMNDNRDVDKLYV